MTPLTESVFNQTSQTLESNSIAGAQRRRKDVQRRLRKMARDGRRRKAGARTAEVAGRGSEFLELEHIHSANQGGSRPGTSIWFGNS